MSDLRKGTEINSSAFIPPHPFSQRFLQMPAMLGFHYSQTKREEIAKAKKNTLSKGYYTFSLIYKEYFTESAGARYFVRVVDVSGFLIQKRVRIYRTKHFPCGIVFIIYILRHSSLWQPF